MMVIMRNIPATMILAAVPPPPSPIRCRRCWVITG
jgi:hypothetical protein